MPASLISRIYTPPTCTLEIRAQQAALSRWFGKPVLQSLQFLLSFEGVNPAARESIEIQGDQTQLSTLTEAVTTYIHNLLAYCPTDLPLTAAMSGRSSMLDPTAPVQLRPRSLLTHELMLGELATEQSGPSLVLKTSQLYDLATALDNCTADLQQLPSQIAAPSRSLVGLPLLRSAAVVVLTVGLGTATWRLLQTGPIVQQPLAPTATTALTPSKTPIAKVVIPPPPAASSTSPLPTIQLPTRSDNPFAKPKLQNPTESRSNTDVFSASQSLSQSSTPKSPEPSAAEPPSDRDQSSTIALQPITPDAPAGTITPPSAMTRKNAAQSTQEFSQSLESAPAAAPSQPTLFDTASQVEEVRDYIAARWKPASPPPKTLEYRLTLNPDGSLGQVEPLGASAQQYLTQLPLPTSQTPFVSPISAGTSSNIRLVVRPDGTVQTFLDSTAP
jgi:hypothetical protein